MKLTRTHRLLAAGLSAVALAAVGYAWASPSLLATGGERGTNVLVVGLDTRAGLSRQEREELHVGNHGCGCTDVMMLAHLSKDGRRVSVISIPRDSYVRYAPHKDRKTGKRTVTHYGKINSAYQHGGADLTVRTVEQATGVHIDQFIQTTFGDFAQAVDDLGGARVCTKKPLRDDYSGVDLTPGTHHLDGVHTLRYVRTRHVDPPGDLPRMRRQQRVVADVMRHILGGGSLDDAEGRAKLVRTLLKSVKTNDDTGFTDLVRLGYAARHVSLARSEFATVPIAGVNYVTPEWGSSVKWDNERAQPLFRAIREDRPFTPEDMRDGAVRGDTEGRAAPGTKLLCGGR